MLTPAVLTPKVPLTVNAIKGILGLASIVLVSMSAANAYVQNYNNAYLTYLL